MNLFLHRSRRHLRFAAFCMALAALLPAIGGCDYARMTDDEAVNTYGQKMPAMPRHTVPLDGGIEALRTADPRALVNPLAATPENVAQGHTAYGYFCIPCHGPLADGNGTVGQSFAPLPTDLRTPAAREQGDGELFVKISLGYKRHPPLALTVAENDRWAIIRYLRTLPPAPSSPPPGK